MQRSVSCAISRHDRRRERTTIRRVSDIRSRLVLLFPLAPVLLSLALLGLAATSRGYVTPASQQFSSAIPWIPYALPSLLVLLFLTVELCVWGICQLSPRRWITEAPENVAEAIDVYVRSRMICFQILYSFDHNRHIPNYSVASHISHLLPLVVLDLSHGYASGIVVSSPPYGCIP